MQNNFITEIVSGGQTGVDLAALDIAEELKISSSGWCPYQRKYEDGIIPTKYNLKEAPAPKPEQSSDPDAIYKIRTELNAKDSDGTLIILNESPIGGTFYTIEMAKKYQKPYLIFNLSGSQKISDIVDWIIKQNIHKLNVAGPRASQSPGIYNSACDILRQVFDHQLLNQKQRTLMKDKRYQAKL